MGAGRGAAVVCIATDGDFAECLRRVLAHTPAAVPILLYGEAGAPGGLPEGREVGVAPTLDAALASCAPADVVLLRADCLVAAGWLEGLREAAYADAAVATATPLSGRGIGAPEPPDASSLDAGAAAVRAGSARLRPRLRAAGGHCSYVRRSASELVGGFDSEFSDRCLGAGLAHVAADDVLVFAPAADVFDGARHPRLARSLSIARRSLTELSVLIDARVLTGPMNGSHVHVLELIGALARSGQAKVTALLPPDVSHHARSVLEGLPEVELTAAPNPGQRADIAHRPFQISSPADLNLLAGRADRVVITNQDLISYHNPFHFKSFDAWEGYREVTRRGLAAADRVLFFSAHARDDAVTEELVERHRATVVHIGVDHQVLARDPQASAPAGSTRLRPGADTMLFIGTDYRHKNRVFAQRLVTELQRRHGWDGQLVLAGAHMEWGSSAGEEAALLRSDERLREAVVDLGAVSEAEKAWLLGHAKLVLYPSVYEGFGLVPFEAAEHGVPCLWAAGTSLSEILPDDAAGIIPWDAAAAADAALALMRDEQVRARHLEAVRDAGDEFRWDRTAERLLAVYRTTCAEPPTPAGAYERREGVMRGGLSDDAMRLVGPDGLLPRALERPLLALASHPKIGTPVFRAVKAGYRASQRWRRGLGDRAP